MALADILDFLLKIEGPYKWYVISTVIVVMTAFLTRFIFKTLKWFFIIAVFGVLIVAAASYFFGIDFLSRGEDADSPDDQVMHEGTSSDSDISPAP